MKHRRSGLRFLALFVATALGGPAAAQVPPHQPGTICFTPRFWCWMQFPSYPGQLCYCPTPYGPVQGTSG